eukprot:3914770-Prymnesium_polylepis.1
MASRWWAHAAAVGPSNASAEVYEKNMRELRNIGMCSFGSATLVEMVDSREQFVAKKISLEHMGEEEKVKALNEASLLRSLHHLHITEYFGSFVRGNTLHILMEYCSGGSLQQVMARRERADERFDEGGDLRLVSADCDRARVRPRAEDPAPRHQDVQRLPDEAEH